MEVDNLALPSFLEARPLRRLELTGSFTPPAELFFRRSLAGEVAKAYLTGVRGPDTREVPESFVIDTTVLLLMDEAFLHFCCGDNQCNR